MMKYALNHPYKFSAPYKAFMAVFTHFIMNILIEVSCILVILTSTTPLSIVMNFIAIFIVDSFDVIVYESLKREETRALIENQINK